MVISALIVRIIVIVIIVILIIIIIIVTIIIIEIIIVIIIVEVVVVAIIGRKEMFYLTTHSTHFIYGYMASNIWLRTILIVRKETRCRT